MRRILCFLLGFLEIIIVIPALMMISVGMMLVSVYDILNDSSKMISRGRYLPDDE